jgi:hypothetical protein
MNRRSITSIVIFIAAMMILSLLLGCTSTKTKAPADEKSGTDQGRIIVPDSKPAPVDSTAPVTDGGSQGSGAGGEQITSTVGGEPEVKAAIKITLFIDGTEHPLNQPIPVIEGQQITCEFRFTSTGSELREYTIETPNKMALRQQARLKGYDAKVPFTFTYISRNWTEPGIKVTVVNQAGSAEFRQILVMPVDKPLPGRR